MANMFNINSLSYTSRENPEWFTRAMFGGRLIQGGYITPVTGVKGEELLSQIDLNNKVLQIDGGNCGWTPNQIIKLSEKRAKVKTYKINLEQCIDEFERKRTVYMLSPGAKNDSLPPELEQATLQLIAISLSNELEELIVGGDTTQNPNQIDGMEKILTDSAESVQLAGVALTRANVLDQFEKIYHAIPEDVLQAEDRGTLFFMCSYNTRRLIRAALADKNNQVIAAAWTVNDSDPQNPRTYYLGVEVVPAKGIGNSTVIAYDSTNALFLTDLMSDLEDIRLGNHPAPKDNMMFIDGRLRIGFVIPFEGEMVIYSTAITADRPAQPADGTLGLAPNSLVFPAAGGDGAFQVITDEGVTPVIGAAPDGFTVSAGTTTGGATTVTVTAEDNSGNSRPRTGVIRVQLPDSDRTATVTLNQRMEDAPVITP